MVTIKIKTIYNFLLYYLIDMEEMSGIKWIFYYLIL